MCDRRFKNTKVSRFRENFLTTIPRRKTSSTETRTSGFSSHFFFTLWPSLLPEISTSLWNNHTVGPYQVASALGGAWGSLEEFLKVYSSKRRGIISAQIWFLSPPCMMAIPSHPLNDKPQMKVLATKTLRNINSVENLKQLVCSKN